MTVVPARLSIVTLGARDMGVLRAFYRALGWPELPSGDDTWTSFLLVPLAMLRLLARRVETRRLRAFPARLRPTYAASAGHGTHGDYVATRLA